jgi:hypothetical protein
MPQKSNRPSPNEGRQPLVEIANLGQLERVIEHHRDDLINHAFVKRLEGIGDPGQMRSMVSLMAFFTLAFQDVLRLARTKCTDPELREFARSLELGDRGHDRWFVEDATLLKVPLDLDLLFSRAHQPSRDAAYTLVSQVLTANDDYSRIAVMLSLEAAAHEFFVRIPGFVSRLGLGLELKYFGVKHLEAEESHEIFTHDAQARLARIEIPVELRRIVVGVVSSTFAAMTLLGDALDVDMGRSSGSRG